MKLCISNANKNMPKYTDQQIVQFVDQKPHKRLLLETVKTQICSMSAKINLQRK